MGGHEVEAGLPTLMEGLDGCQAQIVYVTPGPLCCRGLCSATLLEACQWAQMFFALFSLLRDTSDYL